MPENISNIAKYNIENGTHFGKLSQVNQHKQQKASEEFEKKHPILASFTKSAQDARDAKIGAIGAGQVRDLYNTGNNALASELNQKYLGANATGILNVPIGSEIATYGLLGGGLRLSAGTATGAAGSGLGGKAGDLADKQFGTNWIGTAGRIGGGFAGFVPGMNAATRVLRTAAGKGVTLYMPQNTFMGLRGQYFDNTANAAVKHSMPTIVDKNIFAGKIGGSPKESRILWHNSETPISKLKSAFPTGDVTERGAPLGHVGTTGTETTQGFIGARPYHNKGMVELNKPMVQLNESIGNGKNAVRNEILKFADQSGADAVNFSNIKDNTLSNQDVYAVFKDVNVKPKLTEAERLGIPKGDRKNLTQDQIYALADLYGGKTQGRFKNKFGFNPITDTFKGSSKLSNTEVPGVKAIIDAGGSASHMDGPISLRNTYGNFTVGPGKNAKFSANFPIPEDMKGGPGDTTTMLVDNSGHEMKFILTSPKTDAIDAELPQTIIDKLPDTIDKDIMKRYGTMNRQMIRPGTYLSGDNGASPLGAYAMRTFDSSKNIDSAISDILYFKSSLEDVKREGLSPDSGSALVRQGSRPGMELRGGSSFQKGNRSAVKNKSIYDGGIKMKNGEITPEEYKKIFDAGSLPQGGRPLEIVKTPSKVQTITDNNGVIKTITTEPSVYVNIPHPYVLYKKPGGILKAQNGKSFENGYKIVPEDKNDTTSYNLRRAYELAPKEELEAFVTDPNAHLRSAYPTKEGNIEFVKSITHPSLLGELADYNSKPKFNKEGKLSVLKYPYLQYSK